MPKNIENYRKIQEFDLEETKKQRKRVCSITMLIILVISIFLFSAGKDAFQSIEKLQYTMEEKSLLCMAEYSQTSCDTLKLN